MLLHRSIDTPPRQDVSWEEKWKGPDKGLIACWERGREKRNESPELAAEADAGRLVMLPWKGGVDVVPKSKRKVGTLFYLAMWQGLRGEDLSIDTESEPELTCSATGVTVMYTSDSSKYAGREVAGVA